MTTEEKIEYYKKHGLPAGTRFKPFCSWSSTHRMEICEFEETAMLLNRYAYWGGYSFYVVGDPSRGHMKGDETRFVAGAEMVDWDNVPDPPVVSTPPVKHAVVTKPEDLENTRCEECDAPCQVVVYTCPMLNTTKWLCVYCAHRQRGFEKS